MSETTIKKARKSKCSMCEQMFEKEELTVKSNKKYCKDCLPIKEAESIKYANDWDLLFKYICDLYKIKVPTGMMFQQMKTYREDYNYTNIGMYYTLKYYYEILENDVIEGNGLGIIPYYYEKAKIYYNKKYDLEDKIDNFENNEQIVKIKTRVLHKELIKKEPLSLHINWEEVNEND
jgi:ribosomal protein S18